MNRVTVALFDRLGAGEDGGQPVVDEHFAVKGVGFGDAIGKRADAVAGPAVGAGYPLLACLLFPLLPAPLVVEEGVVCGIRRDRWRPVFRRQRRWIR